MTDVLFDKAVQSVGSHKRLADARADAVRRRGSIVIGGTFVVVGFLLVWFFDSKPAGIICALVGAMVFFALLIDTLSGHQGVFAPVSARELETMLARCDDRPAAKQLLLAWLEDGQKIRLRDKMYFDKFVGVVDASYDEQSVRDFTAARLADIKVIKSKTDKLMPLAPDKDDASVL